MVEPANAFAIGTVPAWIWLSTGQKFVRFATLICAAVIGVPFAASPDVRRKDSTMKRDIVSPVVVVIVARWVGSVDVEPNRALAPSSSSFFFFSVPIPDSPPADQPISR